MSDKNRSDHESAHESPLVITNGQAEVAMMTLFDDTLSTISDNQQSLLNSQAANRELLGVVIQDNLNLKEENNRLRERILELERSIARTHRQALDQQEILRQEFERKLSDVQKLATDALVAAQSTAAPDIQAVSTEPGCLGKLLGLGQTQIVTTAAQKHEPAARPTAPSFSYPKPPFPPE